MVAQAQQQAGPDEVPVLAYRRDREGWRFIVPRAGCDAWAFTHDLGFEAFVDWVRQHLDRDATP